MLFLDQRSSHLPVRRAGIARVPHQSRAYPRSCKSGGQSRYLYLHVGAVHPCGCPTGRALPLLRRLPPSTQWMGAGVVAEAGLYRWDSRTDEPPQHVDINTGFVHRFYRSGDTLWIGAERGLFRLDGQASDWNADLKITSDLSNVFTDTK